MIWRVFYCNIPSFRVRGDGLQYFHSTALLWFLLQFVSHLDFFSCFLWKLDSLLLDIWLNYTNGSTVFCNLSHFNVSFMKCLTGLIAASCGQLGSLLRTIHSENTTLRFHLTDGPRASEPCQHGNLKELSNGLANGIYHADDNCLHEWILGQLTCDALRASECGFAILATSSFLSSPNYSTVSRGRRSFPTEGPWERHGVVPRF